MNAPESMKAPKYRPLRFGVTRAKVRAGQDGAQYITAETALAPYARTMAERLHYWAETEPDRVFLARRQKLADGKLGDWITLTYAQFLAQSRAIAQALIDRKLNTERPVVILSENSLEHALVAFGCLLAGIPHCPASPAYSLVSVDYDKLRHIMKTLTPGLVFATDAARYGKAIAAAVPADAEVVLCEGAVEGRKTTNLQELLSTEASSAVEAASDAITPDTIAKFLFTSGSTKLPKAVINTHGMWCANQQQIRQLLPDLVEEPPVLVDWLPWNHTFGGNHNIGIALYNGGTLYIDDGKPSPALIGETLRNLREIAPTVYFNVPTGFEAIANAMKTDTVLRKTLLSRVRMFFYAGAALAQPIWDALFEAQEAEIGERIVMGTGLGMTESSPMAIFITSPNVRSGDLGLPVPGLELKLAPVDDKVEVRYKGPNITPGYWRMQEATEEVFDDEGFFCTGDAVKWIDENDPNKGLHFDGRIAEDFKLATGTFVSVGPLRSKIITAGAPLVQDVVITGLNLNEVGALIFPVGPACRKLSGLPETASLREVLDSAPVRAHFQRALDQLAKAATGSASRVARMYVMDEPPSIDKGEVTDKGSINQRAVLKHRADLVTTLHDGTLAGALLPNT